MCYILQLLKVMVFFVGLHVFLQLSWIGLSPFWNTYIGRNIPFKNYLNFNRETMCKRLLLLTHMIFFHEINVFLHLSWIGLFGTKWDILNLENNNLHEEFLSKLTQFSQGNNVQDGTSSNTYEFLLRDTCVSSTQNNRPIWNKESLSPPWKSHLQGSVSF
jgi:hypothetical protein